MRKKEQGRRHGFEIEKERAGGRVSEKSTNIGPKTKKKVKKRFSKEKMNRMRKKEKKNLRGSLKKPRKTPKYDPCGFLYYLSTFQIGVLILEIIL